MKKFDIKNKIYLIIIIAIIVVINIIAQFLFFKVDLTEDKRYTLSDSTKALLKDMDKQVYAEVLLDGKFPAGFKRLQNSTKELLRTFKSYYPNLDYKFEDPSKGTIQERKSQAKILRDNGIMGTRLTFKEGDELVEKYIYPYIMLHYSDKMVVVNLLEEQLSNNPEQTLNKSVSLLEYKMIEALTTILRPKKKNILFTTGQGELDEPHMSELGKALKPYYNTDFVNLDSTYMISADLDVLIVAQPRETFSEKKVFLIDQYVMNGGKVLWLVDKFDVSLDSVNLQRNYVPKPIHTGLEDLLYKYGVRVEDDLIVDLECTKIPQVVGKAGGKAQTELFNWFYHPLLIPGSDHPVVTNIDRVNSKFPSSISLIKTKSKVAKTVLLQSSKFSRLQLYPMQINFEILRYKADPKKFNNGNKPVAVLLEGEFESLFKNRVGEEMKSGLEKLNMKYRELSVPTKQIVISDAEILRNSYNVKSNRVFPIGYNFWEKKVYPGNKDFILNAINYLATSDDILGAKAKRVKLRLLNKVKIENEQLKWQLMNVLGPILMILLFGLVYNWRRKKKYTQ